MTTITFDTHFFIKKLQEKGFPEPQAETLVNVFREMQDVTFKETVRPQTLDTKADRKEVETQYEALRRDIAEIKVDMFKWMIPLFLGQYGLLIGLFATLVLKSH